ncbi:tetraacyldisaccharide 4'-kinase [uncultured Dokdonia sp.]|uniref:tetraacyldisaccharide 4'-kinase n=1 Tax=uncultured Dokdonia sp. TaxID=575653 RepID=UPI0030EEF347|tara:strand:- start:30830 stop:31840 length:1011 start_codon:yes stop_codon:yes gene_type:complete
MRKLRLLLFPVAGIYYLVTLTRNKLYDTGIFKSKKYDIPVICVGNLSVGGTGKSPMTEFVVRLLQDNYRVATLSRGYGRKTKGYLDVHPENKATMVGDEPLQFAQKFKNIQVAVCEDRQTGIETLLSKVNAPEVIVLDDAYQHRKVEAGFYILLTAYSGLYSNDFLLPAGNLREPRAGASRADVVVVTKCPENLSSQEQASIVDSLNVNNTQQVFFSTISYDEQVYSVLGPVPLNRLKVKNVTLVTGIANPKPLSVYLASQGLSFSHEAYGDHHNFTSSEIEMLDTLDCILTTEKDYVRLRPLLKMSDLYYLPIKAQFLDGEELLSEEIKNFVSSF